jgi:cellulose 1,4-beta-cellobiosidase
VTQWNETRVTQFFIQDGQKIDMPTPTWEGMPEENGLSAQMCTVQPAIFNERARFDEIGGWDEHVKQLLKQPMVLTMSIDVDVGLLCFLPEF